MILTPGRKFFSTAYSSRLIGLDCIMLLLDDCRMCTVPTAAPTARAFSSLQTLRASMARNAAVVPFFTALQSDPGFIACPVVPALLWRTPIVVVGCPLLQISSDFLLAIVAYGWTNFYSSRAKARCVDERATPICPSAIPSTSSWMMSATCCYF